MKRRQFVKGAALVGSGAVATAASGLAAPAIAQERTEWRMVTTWPKNFPGLGVGAQRLADRITAMSGGRLTVTVFSGGELVPPLESFDAVAGGSAEISHGAAYYWQGKSRGLVFFTGVPFGMTSREMAAWVRYMGGQEIWDEINDQFGVKAFLSGDTGTQAGGWFKEPLETVADIQGINFRTPGLGGQVWERLGATVVNLPAGQIFQNLQSGALNAAEFVGPYNDLALGFHQVAKNYYFPSFNEPGLATELAVNKSALTSLTPDLQLIVEIACQAEYDQVASDFYANDPPALKTLVEDHGVQVRQFPDEIIEAAAGHAADIYGELREDGDALTRKAMESFFTALNALRTRTAMVDNAFVTAREKYFHFS
ncbi:MAG: TRAP transporter substrate-binding protein [Alphaproteobacteria bacterium]